MTAPSLPKERGAPACEQNGVRTEILRRLAANIDSRHDAKRKAIYRLDGMQQDGLAVLLIEDYLALLDALRWIGAGDTEVFDEDLQTMVLVAASPEEMSERAHAALSKATGGAS